MWCFTFLTRERDVEDRIPDPINFLAFMLDELEPCSWITLMFPSYFVEMFIAWRFNRFYFFWQMNFNFPFPLPFWIILHGWLPFLLDMYCYCYKVLRVLFVSWYAPKVVSLGSPTQQRDILLSSIVLWYPLQINAISLLINTHTLLWLPLLVLTPLVEHFSESRTNTFNQMQYTQSSVTSKLL